MGTSHHSAIAETTRGINFHPSQEPGATGWSRAARHSPWWLQRRMEAFRASKPAAGRGSMRGSETGLLQNGRIRDAKSSQLVQPSQLRVCFFKRQARGVRENVGFWG